MNKMNQTQTRSPRKRLLSLILAVILMIGLLPISAFATSASAQAGEDKAATQDSEFLRIFHLDCGRKYFTVSEIEGIIDQLAENHYTHIQLAFGNDGLRFLLDDMSLTVNGTKYDSEKVKSAVKSGNSTYSSSNSTASTMLTEGDMDAIIKYANNKGIQVIPMFNSPYHMDALLNAMENLGITDARKELNNVNRYLNLESANAVAFVKALQQKYMNYFKSKDCKYYNIATDEYAFDHITNAVYTEFAKYVNDLAKMVKDTGMTPLAYNDGFYWTTLKSDVDFDSDVQICYWSNGGHRAPAATLIEKGHKILNNNDSWYYVLGDALSAWANPQWRYQDAADAIPKVPVTQIKGYSGSTLPVGSVLCCWCDYPSKSYPYTSNDNKTGVNDVYALIALMAKCNSDYFKDTTPVLAPVDGGTVSPVKQADGSYNVAVAADDTVQLKLSNASDVSWSSSDETVATVNAATGLVTFTGKTGTVKITAQILPVTRAAEGTSYTVTFNVTEKGAPIPVTVAVGRTVKETLQGDQTTISGDSNYNEYVTVTAEHKTTTAGKKLLEITSASDLVSGAQYLIANQRHKGLLTGDPSSNWDSNYTGLELSGKASSGNNTNLWTITQSGSAYTAQYKGSNYLTIGENVATVGGSNTSTINLAYNNDGYWTISQNGYYLNNLGNSNTAGGWNGNGAATDPGSRWTIYRIVDEGATDTTTVSFTGKKVGGPVTVTVGDTTYSVTVVKKQNVEIPISIIDYRADGLLFDWNYLQGDYSDSYRYSLVHGKSGSYGYVDATEDSTTGLYTVDGNNSAVEQIAGTKIEQTGPVNGTYGTTFYTGNLDNSWSRAGLVKEKLGANGMPVYTDAAVKYVASLLKAGYYNEMSGNCNSLIYDTFVASNGSRTIRKTSADGFSANFENAKTYANISNAYDLAWYLLNTIYQADTNMTTVTGTDTKEHSVPIYGMAVDAYKSIVLTDNGDGTYSFEAGYSGNPKYVDYDRTNGTISQGTGGTATVGFYPLDGLGYEQSGLLTKTSAIDATHNGGFTLRGESQFVYNKASNLYFTFTGDDDVYMYINGVLALDLGGAHGRNSKTVNLNDLASNEDYGLKEGQVATFTFFYMERCSDASTFGIETNMKLVQREINVEKKAYDTSYANEYASGTAVINGTTVAYDLIVTNKSNSPMTQIKLTDTDSLHSENGSENGKAELGYDVTTPSVKPSTLKDDRGTVALGQGNGYVLFITDSTGTEVANTRKSLDNLKALSDEIAGLTLPAGQSLHVRFLTAKTEINESKILDYINTVEVSATVGGQALSDTASHELYSYNANDTGRTYVVDFGLPLEITGIFDTGAQSNIDEVSLSPNNVQKYGTVTIAPNGFNTTLTYTRTANKTINEPETITLDVVYKIGNSNIKLEKTLTIIPASNVYYEDNLATFTNGSGAALGANWKLVDSNGNENVTEDTTTTQVLQQLGDKAIYGYDVAYNSSSMLSMGTAHKVTVTAAMANTDAWTAQPTSAWPTAQFTFKGTGFDIISLTNNKSGAIFVDVYKAGEEKPTYSYIVDNYYGYNYNKETGKWDVVNSGTENALYQIPVMKVTGLDYGEYNAVVTVFYDGLFNQTGDSQYSFWLDAVRIYDPMGVDRTEYKDDHEGYPQYIKLRDTLAKSTIGTTLFIDGKDNATIAEYANYGPNNEVYLMNGQAITFKIPQNANVDSIQIGAKAPNGNTTMTVTGTNDTVLATEALSTATEMYYKINVNVSAADQTVVIANKDGTGILSLTNLKITFKNKPTDKITLTALNNQEQENAVSLVRALFTAPVATFSPETFEADWGRAVRAGKKATLTVKTSADVESITVDGQSITRYTTRTQRTGWGWWSPKVTYHVFTYTITAPAQTTDYAVCAVNAEGTASEAVTATLTVKPTTWWNWWF